MNDVFVFPMSFGQQRLWMLDQMSSKKSIYNLPLAFALKGLVHPLVLEKAINQLSNRYEILRTNFGYIDSKPAQIIHPGASIKLDQSSVENLEQAEKERQLQTLIQRAVSLDFDLENDPLVRLQLIRKDKSEYVFVVVMHHIISDSWSLRLFCQEFFFVYNKFLLDPNFRCEDQPIQYADFTIWQHDWLNSEAYRKQLEFWKTTLAGIPNYIDLPLDKIRPSVQTYDGACLSFKFPPKLYDAIGSLSSQNNCTIFMTMLSAFSILMGQANGHEEVVIGTPVMSRPQKELESQIGFFLNTLALRIPLSRELSFEVMNAETKKNVLSAFDNINLPFEKLIEEINPPRDISYSPVFQVMFSMHEEKTYGVHAGDLDVQLLEIAETSSKFDITLYIERDKNGVTGRFEYNTALFEPSTIENFQRRFLTILERIVANPKASIAEITSIPAYEISRINEWNNTVTAYDSTETIISQFARQVAISPDDVAVVYKEESVTYRELDQLSNRLAFSLLKIGVKVEDTVGLFAERSVDLLIGIFGILKSGACYLPLDPTLPVDRLKYLIENASVNVMVCTQSQAQAATVFGTNVTAIIRVLSVNDNEQSLPSLSSSNLAYTMYTSGSTGKPKGVNITHKNVVNFFAGMDAHMGTEKGTWLALTTFTFDISVLELIWTLTRGFKVVMQPEMRSVNNAPSKKRKMDFSLFYFASSNTNEGDKYKLLLDGAKFGDENGFTAIWTPERHFHEFGGLFPNPAVLGAAIAATTKHIGIRGGSVVVPLHNPIRIAEEWSVVDNLSGGRVGIACASGWHANDFVLAPDNYENRHKILYERLDTLQKLWRGTPVAFNDGNGSEKLVNIFPEPVQKDIPVWITSGGNIDTFKSAGRLGLNLLTHLLGDTIEGLAEKITAYRTALSESGHDPISRTVTLMLHTFVGEDLNKVHDQVREPFIRYLRSSFGLMKNLVTSMGYSVHSNDFTEDDLAAILNNAFGRYVGTSGLIGTQDICMQMLDKLTAAGVTEVACLVDFGLDYESTMQSLQHLAKLKDAHNKDVSATDYSIQALVKRHRVTHIQCTPSFATILNADTLWFDALKSVKKILLGGERVPHSLVKDIYEHLPDVEVFNMYGPTETTIWSTCTRIDRNADKILIGKPIVNTIILILDGNLSIVPIGSKGEIFIGGDGVARGYRNADLTKAAFIDSPFSSGKLYRTGDFGRYTATGDLEYLGRADSQIKIRGHRIELGEIESVLASCLDVQDAAVLVDDDTSEIVACVTLHQAKPDRTRVDSSSSRSMANEKDVLQKPAGRELYELPNGMRIDHYRPHTSNSLYNEIFIDNEYLVEGITVSSDACVIDAGANIGLFSLFLKQEVPGVRIFAFEPIPPTYDRLQLNFINHNIEGKVYRKGLSDKSEISEFTHYPEMSGISGRFSEQHSDVRAAINVAQTYLDHQGEASTEELSKIIEQRYAAEKYICELTTISEVIKEQGLSKIDLLKIDVEKSELLVLDGIGNEDWDKIEQLVLEVDTFDHKEKVMDRLTAKGYHVWEKPLVVVSEMNGGDGIAAYMVYATRNNVLSHSGAESRWKKAVTTESDLRRFLKERLPDYMIPKELKILDKLPLNSNGKIDRTALKKIKFQSTPSFHYQHDANNHSLTDAITGIWKELLQREDISVNDNFFDKGGHSLLLLTMQNKIRSILQVEINVIELFKFPTITSLVDFLSGKKDNAVNQDRAKMRKARTSATERIKERKRTL